MSTVDYVILGSYLLFLMGMGPAFKSFSKNASDFFRAGGTMIWWVAGASVFMTGFTAWSFTGGAAKAYETGFFFMVLFACNFVSAIITYLFLAAKFRQMRVVTPVEAIRKRFGRVNEQVYTWLPFPLGILFGGIALYVLAVFTTAVFGIDTRLLIIILGVTVLVISTIGGAWAAHASDFVQMLVFVAITLVMVIATLNHPQVDGVANLMQNLPGAHWDWGQIGRPWVIALFIVTLLLNQTIQGNTLNAGAGKYILVKSGRDARRVTLMSMICSLLATPMWMIPALASTQVHPELQVLTDLKPRIAMIEREQNVQIKDLGQLQLLASQSDTPAMAEVSALVAKARGLNASQDEEYLNKYLKLNNPNEAAYIGMAISILPRGLLGLLVCGIFSATLTSMTAGFNGAAGVMVRNFYLPVINPKATERSQLVLGKAVTLCYGLAVIGVGLIFSRFQSLPLFDLILLFAASVGIPQGMPMFLGIFIKRAPAWSAWSTLLVGFAVSLSLRFILTHGNMQRMIGADPALTPRELGDLNIALTTAVLIIVCTTWFLFCTWFEIRQEKKAGLAKAKLPVEDIPVGARPDAAEAIAEHDFPVATKPWTWRDLFADSAERRLEVEAFFRDMNTPIDMATEHGGESHESDDKQYRVLGVMSMIYGAFILVLAAVPNTPSGHMGLAFCGGSIAGVGLILYLISRRRAANRARRVVEDPQANVPMPPPAIVRS